MGGKFTGTASKQSLSHPDVQSANDGEGSEADVTPPLRWSILSGEGDVGE